MINLNANQTDLTNDYNTLTTSIYLKANPPNLTNGYYILNSAIG